MKTQPFTSRLGWATASGAAILDGVLSCEGFSRSFGGDLTASAAGALMPVAALAAAAVARKSGDSRAVGLAVVLAALCVTGNVLCLNGRMESSLKGERGIEAQLAGLPTAREAEVNRAKAKADAARANSEAVGRRLASELATGRGPKAEALERELAGATAAVATAESDLDGIASKWGAEEARLVAEADLARKQVPPHLAAVRRWVPREHQDTALGVILMSLAVAISVTGPVLAAALSGSDPQPQPVPAPAAEPAKPPRRKRRKTNRKAPEPAPKVRRSPRGLDALLSRWN